MRSAVIGLMLACACGGPVDDVRGPSINCNAAYVCPGATHVWEPAVYTPLEGKDPAGWNECRCQVGDKAALFWYIPYTHQVACDQQRASWDRLVSLNCVPG